MRDSRSLASLNPSPPLPWLWLHLPCRSSKMIPPPNHCSQTTTRSTSRRRISSLPCLCKWLHQHRWQATAVVAVAVVPAGAVGVAVVVAAASTAPTGLGHDVPSGAHPPRGQGKKRSLRKGTAAGAKMRSRMVIPRYPHLPQPARGRVRPIRGVDPRPSRRRVLSRCSLPRLAHLRRRCCEGM